MKLNSLLVVVLLAAQMTWAADAGKHNLNISGLSPEVQTELHHRWPQIAAKTLTLENIDDIIRFLQARPDYDLVRVVDTGGGQYKVTTERSTRVSAVKFEGLHAMSESEARSIFGVNPGDVLNQDIFQSGGQKLINQFNQIGYRNASMDVELPPDGKGDVQLILKIKEGVQTLIGGFTFTSQNTELNKALESRLSREKGNALTDAQIADIMTRIREYLNSRYYIRTEIKGPEIALNADESKAQLSFHLEKVDAYQLEYLGNREISGSSINNALDLGNFYSANPKRFLA